MSTQIAVWLLAAVLGCWCVGAYNRLVRLRQGVAAAFRAVLEAMAGRYRQVGEWLGAVRPAADDAVGLLAAWQAVEAAWRQAQAAADHAAAGRRTADAALLASLALADRVLRGALAQWATVAGEHVGAAGESPQPGEPAFTPVAAALSAEAAVDAARLGFNAAAEGYNQALRQFPTRIVGWLFGFHVAGVL